MRTTALIAAPALLALYPLWPSAASDVTPCPLPATAAPAARVVDGGSAAPFVPNLGQWPHHARFVHRSGPMTVFLEDRGWVLDLVEGVAVGMSFEGDAGRSDAHGEAPLAGHHNYFLGADPRRWRTGVPLYSSVRYAQVYPGIDVRLRRADRAPEYDLLLHPGADLAQVVVHVDGAQGLSLDAAGALVITTARGTLTQPRPRTWEIDAAGVRREVGCEFELLGPARFGFRAPGWDGTTSLTIDPPLIWSTFVGGSSYEYADAVDVDPHGVVTLAGHSFAPDYPRTRGAYDPGHNGSEDVVITRLDPSRTGSAQLLDSTFVGGSGAERGLALAVAGDVVTVAGYTTSADFPKVRGAFDTAYDRSEDGFVVRLDLARTGSGQLAYASYLGGNSGDLIYGLAVDDNGVITVQGRTFSTDFPTTAGALDPTMNDWDVFVSQLDPRRTGRAQLVYSTFLGGRGHDWASALDVDAGVITVTGYTDSADFPTTAGAFDTTFGGGRTVYVSQLDPRRTGRAQLVYSTFLGDLGDDRAAAVSVDNGQITVAGYTRSAAFPTTGGAYDTTHNGGVDAYVSRLDPTRSGRAQLVYSTLLGGVRDERAYALAVGAGGVVTLTGETYSPDFPTTPGAYDRVKSGSADTFVARLDPAAAGAAQLVHATFLGGWSTDDAHALAVDGSGVATVAGGTLSHDLPTTRGAFDPSHNGSRDIFVSRLRMDATFYADRHELSLRRAGTQTLRLEAGSRHAGQNYAIFGSATGTTPGINLGVHIPLNIDSYTRITIGSAVPPIFGDFRGQLDRSGTATATFNVPANLPSLPGLTLYHAYIVFDGQGNFRMASNPVPLRLR